MPPNAQIPRLVFMRRPYRCRRGLGQVLAPFSQKSNIGGRRSTGAGATVDAVRRPCDGAAHPGGAGRRSRRCTEEGKRVRGIRRKALILVLGAAVAALAISAAAVASTKKKSANVQVCVLLPDTQSSVRWVQFDAPLLKKAFANAGVTASINNALNDP